MKNLFNEWEKRTDITGVSSGTKVVNGINTGEPCIVFYVPRKKALTELKRNEKFPKKINGVKVDVREEIFYALGSAPAQIKPFAGWAPGGSRTAKYRPAPGGVSVGHYLITAGTLATWCYLGGRVVMLSNNHVLANCNDGAIGDPILQPGTYDGGVNPTDKIGELLDFIEILFDGSYNEADCAIASVDDITDADFQIADLTPMCSYWTSAQVSMAITKSGRTTGVTKSTVYAIDGVIQVTYPGDRIAKFENQIIVWEGGFIQPGDSGSLCMQLPDSGNPDTAIGLCFAGSLMTGIICPMAPIVDGLKINFSSPINLYVTAKKGGTGVGGAKVFAFNLTTQQFIYFNETTADGLVVFPLAAFKYDKLIIFAQYEFGIGAYTGWVYTNCPNPDNHLDINLNSYTPIPDGHDVMFKLQNPDWLKTDFDLDEYLSIRF